MGVLVLDVSAGRGCEEVWECVSVDHISGRDRGNGVYDGRGRCRGWYGGNRCDNNGQGKVFDGDVFIEGKGEEWLTFDNVGGVGRNGGDWARELIDETMVGGGEVLVFNNGGVGELDDQVVEVVAGEFLGGNVSKDIKESLIVDEGGRRAGDEDGSGGRGCAAGVSRGWEVPGVVGTVEKVLDLLGGSGEVCCVNIIDRRPVK